MGEPPQATACGSRLQTALHPKQETIPHCVWGEELWNEEERVCAEALTALLLTPINTTQRYTSDTRRQHTYVPLPKTNFYEPQR